MVTLYKIENTRITPNEEIIYAELRGLSTDEKPIVYGKRTIGNGSSYIETNTGKVFLYDAENKEWNEV